MVKHRKKEKSKNLNLLISYGFMIIIIIGFSALYTNNVISENKNIKNKLSPASEVTVEGYPSLIHVDDFENPEKSYEKYYLQSSDGTIYILDIELFSIKEYSKISVTGTLNGNIITPTITPTKNIDTPSSYETGNS